MKFGTMTGIGTQQVLSDLGELRSSFALLTVFRYFIGE